MDVRPPAAIDGGLQGKEILVDQSKKEVGHPTGNYKKFYRRLKTSHRFSVNKDMLTAEKLQGVDLLIFAGPREMFSSEEFMTIKNYISQGGSVLVLLGEGGEDKGGTNLNYLLEDYGMSVNSDAVVRTVYHKYHHPKEALISNGVVQKDLVRAARGEKKVEQGVKPSGLNLQITKEEVDVSSFGNEGSGLEFVYPYGATLNVQKPAIPILSSGPLSYPLQRPVAAVCSVPNAGRICALGAVRMIDDNFFDLEDNRMLFDTLIAWLLDITAIEFSAPLGDEIAEYQHIPHTQGLAMPLRGCLQEVEALPQDFTQLFDDKLFQFGVELIPEAVLLYEQLGVKREMLTCIVPQFETPMPALQAAVFPATIVEPPRPALDLFDLDEHFASERARLAMLANKCTDDDLDFFVREAGGILGVTPKLDIQCRRSSKHYLEFIFKELLRFKMMNQEEHINGAYQE